MSIFPCSTSVLKMSLLALLQWAEVSFVQGVVDEDIVRMLCEREGASGGGKLCASVSNSPPAE